MKLGFRSLALSLLLLFSAGSFTPLRSESGQDQLRDYYQSVIDDFEGNLAATQTQGDLYGEAALWQSYSQALTYLGDFESAKTAAETALKLIRSLENPDQRRLENGILWQLITVQNQLGDAFGREFLEQEVERADLDRYSYRLVLEQLVQAYTSLNSDTFFARAQAFAEEAIELARSDGEPHEVVEAQARLATLLNIQGNRRAAIAILREAQRLAQTLEAPHRTSSDRNVTFQLAQTLHLEGQSPEAIALLDALAARAAVETPDDLQNIWVIKMLQAGLYRDTENYDRALQLHQERAAIARQMVENNGHFQLAWTLQDLSELAFWHDDPQGALAYQTEAQEQLELERVRLGQTVNLHSSLAHALSSSQQRLGFLLSRLGQLDAAETELRAALELDAFFRGEVLHNTNSLNADRDELTVGLYGAASDIHRRLQWIYLQQSRLNDALLASEQGRARGFLNLIRNRFASDPQHFDLEPPTLAQIKAIARQENSTIVQYSLLYEYPFYWRYGFGRHKAAGSSQLLIWVITPSGEIHHQVVPLSEIDLSQLIRTMRRRIVSGGRSNRAAPYLKDLHNLLIAPIAAQLPRDPAARVTFIPDDDLFFVPFAALQDANGVELIERHTILTAPSIQVLGESRRNKSRLKPSSSAFVVGNPAMPELPAAPGANRSSLSPLPGAEAEAKAIASLLGTEPLIGPAATETKVVQEMQTAQTIHLATHGLLETSSYANSLALAPTAQDDGFLTVREIAPLKLNAELAVLSACDTGRGNAFNSEGVIGLSRAFVGAGAASVVVSLWAIPDQPTAVLMTEFYRQRAAGVDNATALRQAMLTTRSQFPGPSNWAAFTIMGAVD
ncbi:MAG: CHAT domain-containing protein [Cyanobacteria bacterium P01_G01_bin.54]